MTENQRRAEDVLTWPDLLLRGLTVLALILVALTILLASQPV